MEKWLRVVVIDDDPLERERLLNHLAAAPGVEVVGVLTGDRNTVNAIRRLSPDVIFLDVPLQACTGFELVSALGQGAYSKVVFVTRESEHAVRAFEVGARDYIIKPVDPERLDLALARLRAGTGLFIERFLIKEGGRVYFVRTSTIDWIESDENYIRIHTGGVSHLVRRTLAQVETELDPAQFARIHRSTIVNLDRVREIQPGIGRFRMVLLENGVQLRLSERYYQPLVHETRGPRSSGIGSRQKRGRA